MMKQKILKEENKIGIVGLGYVGLVTSACFAELGHRVICTDNNVKKIKLLKKDKIPIYEPGLEELIAINIKKRRIKFTSSIKELVKNSKIIFITVGTPSLDNGDVNLEYVKEVARSIARNMNGYHLIIEKSTVPVGTGDLIRKIIKNNIVKKIKFDIAANPEFLREGKGVNDFMHPDRIIIGAESEKVKNILTNLYKSFNVPLLVTDIKSAELIKYSSNSLLATKISFVNAVSIICDKLGANIVDVAKGIGLDKRIGPHFLNAGIGYGGSCFPKDVDAFINISDKMGYNFELLKSVRRVNKEQRYYFIEKIEDVLGNIKNKTIAILGLAFKPDTDDIRFAPSIDIIKDLQEKGAKIKAYDPYAMKNAACVLSNVKFCGNSYEAAESSDCLIIVTEWVEFRGLNLLRIKNLLRRPLIIDGRNIYEQKQLKELGFKYFSLGRPPVI